MADFSMPAQGLVPATKTVVYATPLGAFEVDAQDMITGDAFHVRPSQTYVGWATPLVDYLLGLPAIGTYIDAGAHIGMTTIPLARKWLGHPAAPAQYAFEPSPYNHALLTRNLARNGVTGAVRVERLAVGDKPGVKSMAAAIYNTHDHRLVNPATPLVDGGMNDTKHRGRFAVSVVTLDDYFGAIQLQLRRPVVLKVDVQGWDAAVMRGALAVVKPDIVVFELWPYGLLQAGWTLDEFLRVIGHWERGAILIEPEVIPRPGLHLELARMLAWDGIATTATDLLLEGFAP